MEVSFIFLKFLITMKIQLLLLGLFVLSLLVGPWPGILTQGGGCGGGAKGKIDSEEHVGDISNVNVCAQLRPRPEAESSIRGSVWVDSYSLEPRHPS